MIEKTDTTKKLLDATERLVGALEALKLTRGEQATVLNIASEIRLRKSLDETAAGQPASAKDL